MRTAAILIAAVLLSAASANAYPPTHHWVYNASNTCAWFTLDTSSPISTWKNRHGAFIKPGGQIEWTIDPTTELKIRAEPRLNADCSGDKVGDLDIVEKSGWTRLGSSETSLTGHIGAFRLHWGKP